MLRAIALLVTCVFTLSAQDSVSTEFLFHRVWAVVPMVGKGTAEDPKRPMFVPTPAERMRGGAANNLVSYTMQLSDDGNTAFVEFVGRDAAALAFITQSKAPGVKAFEKGKATKAQIEAEFRKGKPDFDLDSFQPTSRQADIAAAKSKGVAK